MLAAPATFLVPAAFPAAAAAAAADGAVVTEDENARNDWWRAVSRSFLEAAAGRGGSEVMRRKSGKVSSAMPLALPWRVWRRRLMT